MNKTKMYQREIQSEKQKFEAFIKKNGFIENLGQPEYRIFLEKVNNCEDIGYADKAMLAFNYAEMLASL